MWYICVCICLCVCVCVCVMTGTSTSSTSWSTVSSDLWGWLPAPRNPPSAMTMSAASSSTGVYVCANVFVCEKATCSVHLCFPLNHWSVNYAGGTETDTEDLKKSFVILFSHCVFSETIMFLHEIFHQGLKARIANWPTLVLGKLLLKLTQCTQHTNTHCMHTLGSHSVTSRSGFQWSSASHLSHSNVSLDVLLPLISLSQSATSRLIVLTDNDHPDQKA